MPVQADHRDELSRNFYLIESHTTGEWVLLSQAHSATPPGWRRVASSGYDEHQNILPKFRNLRQVDRLEEL